MLFGFNTLLLFLILLFNNTLTSLVKTGIEELIVKPLAIRHGTKILQGLRNKSETLKKAWDALDYSLPQDANNFVSFLEDAETYIWDTVLPQVAEPDLDTEQKGALAQYLANNWSQDVFLSKIKGLQAPLTEFLDK